MMTAPIDDALLHAPRSPMGKADDVHYELLRMTVEVYQQNLAVGGAVATRTKETALHAVSTARRAAATAKDNELNALCDEVERKIAAGDFRIAVTADKQTLQDSI